MFDKCIGWGLSGWIANNQQNIGINIHQDFLTRTHSNFFKDRWIGVSSIRIILGNSAVQTQRRKRRNNQSKIHSNWELDATTLSITAFSIKGLFGTFSMPTLSIKTLCHYAECRYPECSIYVLLCQMSLCLSIVMLNVIMLSVVMLSFAVPRMP